MASLAKDIEKVLKGTDKGESFLVHMDGDKKASADKLKEFAKANQITRMALTTNDAGKDSPGGHKVDPKVKFTVVLYEKKKVVENFALDKIDDATRAKIVQGAEKLMGVKAQPKTT